MTDFLFIKGALSRVDLNNPESIVQTFDKIATEELDLMKRGDSELINVQGDHYRDFDNYDICDPQLASNFLRKLGQLLVDCSKADVIIG